MITIPELDELTITIVVDNTTDTLSSIAPGVPQVPEIAYLLGRIPPTGQHDGHDCMVVFDHLCVACHGFSALATARLRKVFSSSKVSTVTSVWLSDQPDIRSTPQVDSSIPSTLARVEATPG